MLIPYAGKEEAANPGRYDERCRRAYARFRLGQNTMQIAKIMNVSEATALKYVTLGRCEWNELRTPYE